MSIAILPSSKNSFYSDYEALRAHFQEKHFLCEDEGCAEEKFTSVFRSEIDLKGKDLVVSVSYSAR